MSKLSRTIFALILAIAGAAGVLPAQVYVAVSGNDTTGNGTTGSPFATLKRALQASSSVIQIESGDYIFNEPVTIPDGVIVTGGFYRNFDIDNQWHYIRTTAPTNFLINTQTPEFQAFPHPAAVKIGNAARLQWVTVKGGYYSAELLAGGAVFEVDFSGGIFSAIYIPTGAAGNPSLVDRCRISGGGYGIRIEGTGSATITDTLSENTIGRALYIAGSGNVAIENSIFQKSSSYGAYIQGNSNVLIQNCVFRKHLSDGIRVVAASPAIRGCLSQLNTEGINLQGSDSAAIVNCTLVDNRSNGIFVNGGLPVFSRNILSRNTHYGIAEQRLEDVEGQPPPIQTGIMADNLFFQNGNGAYLDEGLYPLLSVNDIDTSATNSSFPTGTIIADPKFYNPAKGDYHLKSGSPAIDVVSAVVNYDTDLDGNSRVVDIPAAGNSGSNTADLGGYEAQTSITEKFATEFANTGGATDPSHPGQPAETQTSPRWDWNSASPFGQLAGKILPGRLRLSSTGDNSYGGMGRSLLDDLSQPADKIVIMKVVLEADDPYAVEVPRFRANELDHLDVAPSMIVVGRRALAPPFTGREYEFPYDLRQGGYRAMTPAQKPFYREGVSFDLLDFFLYPYHSQHDLTSLKIDFQDRVAYDAQFTNTAKSWTFAPAETFEWTAGAAPPGFAQPILSYDPSRQSLRFEAFQDLSFSGWGSPLFQLPAGKLFKLECHIANGLAADQGPNFRIRIGTKDVDTDYEMTCFSFPGGSAGPGSSGDVYTVYGRVPDVPALLESGNMVSMSIAVEIFGFGYVGGRPPHAIMYLDDIKVSTAP